jgi:transketolase
MFDSEALALEIRRDTLRMVHAANASHVGSALSIADIVAVLYSSILNVHPDDPDHRDRDRLVLSKGHACTAIYAALANLGFFSHTDLTDYATDHSVLMSHVSHRVPGVEFSTGSLGHGLPFGVGKAKAAKMRGAPWRTFVITSDGEWDEGSNWEAALFASHHGLDNVTAVIDFNNLQSLTTIEETLRLEPLAAKLRTFGWSVQEVDGHDHTELEAALLRVPWDPGKPNAILARTVKGKGVSFMENRVEWHYRSPNNEQLSAALAELGTS